MTVSRADRDGPCASVVIPSGRGARLAFALEALAAQTLPVSQFEVIVVRDPRAFEPPAPPAALTVRYLCAEVGGNIAVLRNIGWREARAPLIVFSDDDCRAAPDWLERLLAEADDPRILVQGRTEPDPDEIHLLHGLARSQEIRGPSPFYQTCNLLYHRSLLEQMGGFDERFGSLGEDADLALRARANGAGLRYVDEAVVWHAVIPRSLPAALTEALSRDTMPALVARHPELRRALYLRLFWRRSHALLSLAALGIAGSRKRRALAVLTIPYLARALDPRAARGPRSYLRRALHLPSKLLIDGTELAVTTRAAVRERALLF